MDAEAQSHEITRIQADCPRCKALEATKAELAQCREAYQILEDAPELNPSNYDHDQVCELNSKMVEACLAFRAALEATKAERGDGGGRVICANCGLEIVSGEALVRTVTSRVLHLTCPVTWSMAGGLITERERATGDAGGRVMDAEAQSHEIARIQAERTDGDDPNEVIRRHLARGGFGDQLDRHPLEQVVGMAINALEAEREGAHKFIEDLEAELAQCGKALEWYADRDHYRDGRPGAPDAVVLPTGDVTPMGSLWRTDRGDRARAALEATKDERGDGGE